MKYPTLAIKNDAIRARAIDMLSTVPLDPVYEMKLVLAESERSAIQNAKLHAMLGDLSEQVKWHGMKLSITVWKRLCTAAMLRDNGEKPMLIPSLDGNGVDIIYEKTSKMGVRMMAKLIEWVQFFGDENGVVWKDPKLPNDY